MMQWIVWLLEVVLSLVPVRLDEFYIDKMNNPEPVLSTFYESFDFSPIDASVFDVQSL